MRYVNCENCESEIPLNRSFKINDNILCSKCAQEEYDKSSTAEQSQYIQQTDPTVCFNCQNDNGNSEWPLIANLPTCDKCASFFLNRPFPNWVKCGFASVIIILLLSFYFNLRFFKAFYYLRGCEQAFLSKNLEMAAKLSENASKQAPEVVWLRAFADLNKGILLLMDNQYQEALDLFLKCKGHLPPHINIDNFITSAEFGVAFDAGDYDRFLQLALKTQNKNPNDPISIAQVASAYACKYAITGNDEYHTKAMDYLERARGIGDNNPDFNKYEDRILHRIETHTIITRKEFEQKYPNGWKLRKEEKK